MRHYRVNRNAQRGAVLMVGLILMAVATLVTLTAMNTGVMQERMTANQHNYARAFMAAEVGGAHLIEWINANGWPNEDDQPALDGQVPGDASMVYHWELAPNTDWSTSPLAFVITGESLSAVDADADETTVLARSRVRVSVDQQPFSDGGDALFKDALLGCQGFRLVGGAQIDSFDSRLGPYGASIPDGTNSLRTGATLRTLTDDATGTLSGNAPLYGDLVFSGQEELSLSNATPVHGNVLTEGNVDMNGTIHGELVARGDVTFGTASNQKGKVISGGDVEIESTGTPPASGVQAAGDVTWPHWWQWEPALMTLAENYQGQQDVANALSPEWAGTLDDQCDPLEFDTPGSVGNSELTSLGLVQLDVEDVIPSDRMRINNNRVQLKAGTDASGRPNSLHDWALGVHGTETVIHVDRDLTTAGSLSSLEIRGDVTLIVDGDLDLGNTTQLNIAEGATLTMYVKGKSTMSGGSNLLQGGSFVVGEGDDARPAVRLFSLYSDVDNNGKVNTNQPGVFVGGDNSTRVVVYAPNTSARIVGSGSIFGSIRAGYVDLRGSGDIHYDEALGEAMMTSGGPDKEGKNLSIVGWSEFLD